ncbi:unnamed protein product, partial [Polarella glacialis]
ADSPEEHPLLAGGNDGGFRRAGRLKLRHDSEQLEHLVSLGKLPEKPYSVVSKVFRQVLEKLPTEFAAVDVGAGVNKLLDRAHNRAIHLTWPGRLSGASALNPGFDSAAVQRRFRESELAPEESSCEAQNGVAYVDNILSDEALQALHTWCLESTMWFSSRSGYVAAFMQEAFNAPLLVQLTEELRRALPDILGSHQLMNMWAF